MWCESEVKALAVEAVLIKLESPLCNVVDGCGSILGKRCKVKGKRKRPSSWLRRSNSPFTSIWSHQSVVRLCTPVSGPSWESRFPGALGLALPFKHLYTLQIRETFAKEGVLGPINLFDWKRVGLLIMICVVIVHSCAALLGSVILWQDFGILLQITLMNLW